MNTPPSANEPVAATIAVSTPSKGDSLMGILIGVGVCISSILGGLAMVEQLSPKYAGLAVCATGILAGILKAIIAFGDYRDNGKMDNSFKLPPGLFGVLLAVLMPLSLASCATDKMSHAQLTLADIGYTAAQGALIVAEASLAEKMADPKTPAWQRLSAQLAVTQARKTLTREQAKLDAAFAALLAGKVPAELSMPAYTGGKTALSVVP